MNCAGKQGGRGAWARKVESGQLFACYDGSIIVLNRLFYIFMKKGSIVEVKQ